MNRLEIKYLNDNTHAELSLCNQLVGTFTVAEKCIQQIYEFYTQNIISIKEVMEHIQRFAVFARLKSNIDGQFGVYYRTYQLFPSVQLKFNALSNAGSVILALSSREMRYCLALEDDAEYTMLSPYFSFKEEVYSFLNFIMHDAGMVTYERGLLLEAVIDESFLRDGNKTSMLN